MFAPVAVAAEEVEQWPSILPSLPSSKHISNDEHLEDKIIKTALCYIVYTTVVHNDMQ